MTTHHTKMSVRIQLAHFLRALGENIGTIGNANEIIRKLKDWPACDNEDIRAAQERIIARVIDACTVILTENQKSNHFLSRYDPLSQVDRLRALVERVKQNEQQYYLFKEARDDKRTRKIFARRAFTSYIPVGSSKRVGTVYPASASAEAISAFE